MKETDKLLTEEDIKRHAVKTLPLTDQQRDSTKRRLVRWRRKPAWTLQESCDIAYGIIPIKPFRYLSGRLMESQDLYDCAVSACRAGHLKPLNPEAPANEWWVNRFDFQRWVIEQTESIGQERSDFLRALYADDLQARPTSPRQRAIDSGYTTDELDACFAVIEHFWSNAQQPDWKRAKDEEIKPWIKAQFPSLSQNAVDRIYSLTNTDARSEPRFIKC